MLAEPSGGRGAEGDAGHLADEEAREQRLALLVGDGVADPGERERDERADGRARHEARGDQHVERGRERAGRRAERGHERGRGDGAVAAVAVAERTAHHLQQAVGKRERGDRGRRRAGGDAVFLGDQRQQRVGGAQARRAGERRQRQQEDCAAQSVASW